MDVKTHELSTNELLPCPFCGTHPVIHKHPDYAQWWLLHRCPAVGPISMDWTSDYTGLVRRWNTRR